MPNLQLRPLPPSVCAAQERRALLNELLRVQQMLCDVPQPSTMERGQLGTRERGSAADGDYPNEEAQALDSAQVPVGCRIRMQRLLIALGVIIIVLGLLWPWIKRLPLFQLPGDIVINRPGFTFFSPITTMLLICAVISLIAWALRK
jgi:hypothetical protein